MFLPITSITSDHLNRPFKFNDYFRYYFPYKITIICSALLIFFHSIVIILQAVLTYRNLSSYNYYSGFWV